MTADNTNDLSGFSLFELFSSEAERQTRIITDGLIGLDRQPDDLQTLERLMRAAHSIKGAAAVVDLKPMVRLAHSMEDCFVAVQNKRFPLSPERVDLLLAALDIITQFIRLEESSALDWIGLNDTNIEKVIAALDRLAETSAAASPSEAAPGPQEAPAMPVAQPENSARPGDQVLKVNAHNFDRLMSLASESRLASHAVQPFLQSMQRFKRKQMEFFSAFEQLHQLVVSSGISGSTKEKSLDLLQKVDPLKKFLTQQLATVEAGERRLLGSSQAMLDEVLALRMRPFRDGVHQFPRMVRDLSRSIGKRIHLEISGEETLVDRDILAVIESPLNHLLRNAIDHGIETPGQRTATGKPVAGTITMEARHIGGLLNIVIGDDGCGVDPERIRARVVASKMLSEQIAADLGTSELMEFLLLPGFSLKDLVTELSGRGVGLDAVHAVVSQYYGAVKVESDYGKRFQVTITLPLSQSTVRALVVDIGDEPYAIPIARIERVLKIPRESLRSLEGKPFFTLGDAHVGLVSAAQLLELGELRSDTAEVPLVIIGSGPRRYALAVDAVAGEQSLAVHPIDAVFGKMRDISAASVLDDGSPVLILDVDDLLLSIEKLLNEGRLHRLHKSPADARKKVKRVLVVDDSLTVREMERKLLRTRGFEVDIAVDGMDGWNAVRSGSFDLVITDVDMPRMDGVELTGLIKRDPQLQDTPVMIVSYKDRPEDRARGIGTGADYYLTKGSFHDETLLRAVHDLIGDSGA